MYRAYNLVLKIAYIGIFSNFFIEFILSYQTYILSKVVINVRGYSLYLIVCPNKTPIIWPCPDGNPIKLELFGLYKYFLIFRGKQSNNDFINIFKIPPNIIALIIINTYASINCCIIGNVHS